MRCQFCHNPDTWAFHNPNAKDRTADDVLKEATRYKSYWGKKGGLTVSGGEPLLQLDFLIDLFKKAKAQGINTTIDTCGQPFTREEPFFSKFQELMEYTDLLLFDIKLIDNAAHKKLTGQKNDNILEMAKYLSEINKPVWIRHVLVPERSDYDEFLIRTDAFIKTLHNVDKVEILPYHTMGKYKWENLGLDYPLEGINPPDKERVENAKALLHTADYVGYKTRVF
jgi:pyruvate formate lyase activating enzyme